MLSLGIWNNRVVKTSDCPLLKGAEGSGEGGRCEDGRETRKSFHEGQSWGCRKTGGVFVLAQRCLDWGPWTSKMGLTWEFVKNAKSPSPSKVVTESKTVGWVSVLFQESSGWL